MGKPFADWLQKKKEAIGQVVKGSTVHTPKHHPHKKRV